MNKDIQFENDNEKQQSLNPLHKPFNRLIISALYRHFVGFVLCAPLTVIWLRNTEN